MASRCRHTLKIKVDYVYSPPSLWRNLANSIIAARTAFPGSEPLLVLRADQLYDWRVLRRIADAPFDTDPRSAPRRLIDAFAPVDTDGQAIEWASGVRLLRLAKRRPLPRAGEGRARPEPAARRPLRTNARQP